MNTSKSTISNIINIPEENIKKIYLYGSQIYGTANSSSDFDYHVVYSGNYNLDGQEFREYNKNINIHTHSLEKWKEHLHNHKIFALECHFYTYKNGQNPLNIDLQKLREEISRVSSNSWVKCKKKLEVENDYYIGIKSLFHSFRIPMFGKQIAEHGRIIDFEEAKQFWEDEFLYHYMTKTPWYELKKQYQSSHNLLMTQFRKLAAKM